MVLLFKVGIALFGNIDGLLRSSSLLFIMYKYILSIFYSFTISTAFMIATAFTIATAFMIATAKLRSYAHEFQECVFFFSRSSSPAA